MPVCFVRSVARNKIVIPIAVELLLLYTSHQLSSETTTTVIAGVEIIREQSIIIHINRLQSMLCAIF